MRIRLCLHRRLARGLLTALPFLAGHSVTAVPPDVDPLPGVTEVTVGAGAT